MAHTDEISKEHLEDIARKISGRLMGGAGRLLLAQGGAIELGESFSVWMLGVESIAGAGHARDLHQLATRTDRWHHQIKSNREAKAFVRSSPPRDAQSSYFVRELVVSPLAKSIDEAIGWVDDKDRNDSLVRMLVVPAYHVVAFWLLNESSNESQVLVISSSRQLKTLFDELARKASDKFITSRDFLEVLRRHDHIVGFS